MGMLVTAYLDFPFLMAEEEFNVLEARRFICALHIEFLKTTYNIFKNLMHYR